MREERKLKGIGHIIRENKIKPTTQCSLITYTVSFYIHFTLIIITNNSYSLILLYYYIWRYDISEIYFISPRLDKTIITGFFSLTGAIT